MDYFDKNNKLLKNEDVIKLDSSVNGSYLFYVNSTQPLDIRYNFDRNLKYEYDQEDLLAVDKYFGESEFEIINE